MTKSEKQQRLNELLKAFEREHRKLKYLKEEMRLLRIEIEKTPIIISERPDELHLKEP